MVKKGIWEESVNKNYIVISKETSYLNAAEPSKSITCLDCVPSSSVGRTLDTIAPRFENHTERLILSAYSLCI